MSSRLMAPQYRHRSTIATGWSTSRSAQCRRQAGHWCASARCPPARPRRPRAPPRVRPSSPGRPCRPPVPPAPSRWAGLGCGSGEGAQAHRTTAPLTHSRGNSASSRGPRQTEVPGVPGTRTHQRFSPARGSLLLPGEPGQESPVCVTSGPVCRRAGENAVAGTARVSQGAR